MGGVDACALLVVAAAYSHRFLNKRHLPCHIPGHSQDMPSVQNLVLLVHLTPK